MQPLNSADRSYLIQLIARLTPSSACRRACLRGRVEVLGGFHEIFPGRPGWIVKVVAEHGTEFLQALIPTQNQHEYTVVTVDRVPWTSWVGKIGLEPYSIFFGDHPEKYCELKEREEQGVWETV